MHSCCGALAGILHSAAILCPSSHLSFSVVTLPEVRLTSHVRALLFPHSLPSCRPQHLTPSNRIRAHLGSFCSALSRSTDFAFLTLQARPSSSKKIALTLLRYLFYRDTCFIVMLWNQTGTISEVCLHMFYLLFICLLH